MSIKTSVAIAVCKASHSLMRAMGRTARALPGKLALSVSPNLIKELSQDHHTLVITGTNGKTTTTHMVQQAIVDTFGTAAYDPTSTNLKQGIATTLCLDSTLGGKRKSDWAIIESDEGATKILLPATLPQVLVVTNLYRDQVDRYPTWTTARDYIIEAIKQSPDTILVLDADCQVTASIADAVPNKVIWFGMECNAYEGDIADFDEKVACIKCGEPLSYKHRTFAHLGDFFCPHCGFTHHRADVAVTAITNKQEKSCDLTLRVFDEEITLSANIRAGYDVYNAAAAFTGLTTAGISRSQASAALGHFKHAAHRFEIFDIEGTETRLLLMKNTAGANQLINVLLSEEHLPQHLVCLLGNEIMDGIYTDWIKDIRWEKILNPDTQVIVGGPCYQDMKDCLLKAGAEQNNLTVETNYQALISTLSTIKEPVTVIANCSTIEDLRLELVKKYKPSDYWSD